MLIFRQPSFKLCIFNSLDLWTLQTDLLFLVCYLCILYFTFLFSNHASILPKQAFIALFIWLCSDSCGTIPFLVACCVFFVTQPYFCFCNLISLVSRVSVCWNAFPLCSYCTCSVNLVLSAQSFCWHCPVPNVRFFVRHSFLAGCTLHIH